MILCFLEKPTTPESSTVQFLYFISGTDITHVGRLTYRDSTIPEVTPLRNFYGELDEQLYHIFEFLQTRTYLVPFLTTHDANLEQYVVEAIHDSDSSLSE
jgi:hypothetical protein